MIDSLEITGVQIKAGRVLLGLQLRPLAAALDLSPATLYRIETLTVAASSGSSVGTLRKLIGHMEARGLRFLENGVLLQKEKAPV